MYKTEKPKSIYKYLNGAVFYKKKSLVTLVETEPENDLKKTGYRNKNSFTLIGFSIFVICCLITVLYRYFREKVYKKRKLNRHRRK